jgi:hypothetical protein
MAALIRGLLQSTKRRSLVEIIIAINPAISSQSHQTTASQEGQTKCRAIKPPSGEARLTYIDTHLVLQR